jgi:hypothetical protein
MMSLESIIHDVIGMEGKRWVQAMVQRSQPLNSDCYVEEHCKSMVEGP